MNMISTGAFQTEMDASVKQEKISGKFIRAWEKKNAKAARAGGVSLMALSLAACGSDDATTATTATDTTTVVDTTPVVVVPTPLSFTLTTATNTFTGADGADTFTATTAAMMQAFDTLDGGTGTDTLVLTDILDAYEGTTGVGGTITNIEGLTLSTSGGVGTAAVAASGAVTVVAGTAAVDTIVYTATTAAKESVIIGGQTYQTATLTGDATGANAAAGVVTLVNTALGGTYAVAGGTNSATVTITAPDKGVDLPDITTSGAGGTDTGVTATTASVEQVAASAQAQTVQFTVGTQSGHASDNTFAVYVGGVSVGTISAVNTTAAAGQQSVATKLAAALNGAIDTGTATAVGNVVTLTADTAGTAMPIVGTVSAGSNALAITKTTTVNNADAAVAASGAVTEAIFDTSGFTGDVSLTVGDNAVVKAAATANLTVASTKGSVDVDGSATVNVSGVGSVAVMGDKITSATVKTGTGAGDTVDIGATTGTVADTPILTSATVTGGTTITISDNKGGATAKTLTTVDLTGIAGTATITGGAMNNLNVGAQTTTQIINIAGATTDHVLNLSVADTGITAAGVAAQVEVNDDTAKSVALTVNGTDNDILLDGDASMVGLTISGAGAAGIALDATTAVTSIDGSAATGNLDLTGVEAVAVTIKTGAGDDTFTTAATAALAADSGDGNDTVTLGAAVAAGSTVNLGGGNDDLISSSGSVATDTAVLITSVDGGAGSDMVAATLYTSGNSNQFTNFEVLGLDVTGSATFDTSLATGMTSLEMLATAAVYTNVGLSQSLAINANAGTGSNTLTFTATDVVGKNDSYEVDFGAKGAATSTAAAPTSIDGGTLVLAGVENVNITSGQASGFVSNVIDVTAVNMKTMTIDGASDTFTLAFAGATGTNTSATDAAVSMIDASGFTGETSIVLTNVVADNTATGLTVKGGEGIDDITTAQEATVYGNGGADTFTISDNATTVYGGAGNDIFEVALAVGSDDVVKIMDLAAGDTINFGTATAFGATAVDVTAQTTLAGALGASDGTDNKVSYFDFGGTTYIILAGATTNAITDDTVIQLVGDVDLSGASLAANVLTIM